MIAALDDLTRFLGDLVELPSGAFASIARFENTSKTYPKHLVGRTVLLSVSK